MMVSFQFRLLLACSLVASLGICIDFPVQEASTHANASQLALVRKTSVDVQEMLELLDDSNKQLSWQQLLINAPTTVFLLGQLVVLSRKRDFKFSPVTVPYKHLKYEYFSPSLIQATNDGWRAFNAAHKNMDAITLSMNSVGGNVMAALTILSKGNADLISRFLRIPLGAIQRDVDKCAVFANENVKQFTDVMELLSELQEAVANTQAITEEKKLQMKLQRDVMDESRKNEAKITDIIKGELNSIKSQLQESRAAYQAAIEAIPTGWELVGQFLVKAIPAIIMGFITGPAGFAAGVASAAGRAVISGGASGNAAVGALSKPATSLSDLGIFGMAGSFAKTVDGVLSKLDGASKSDRPSGLKALSVTADALLGLAMKRADSKWLAPFEAILKDAKKAIDDNKAGNDTSDGTFQTLAGQLKQFGKSSKGLAATGETLNPGIGMPPEPPMSGGADGGNERFVAQMQLSRLSQMEQKHTEIFNSYVEQSRRMNEVILKIASIDLETADFDKILEVIWEAIAILSELKEQWSRLVVFFQRLSIIVNEGLKEESANFKSYLTNIPASQAVLVMSSLRDVFQTSAIRLATYAKVVSTISKTYVNVSDTYILHRLAGLGKLMAATDSSAQHRLLVELQQGSVEAQASIKQQCVDSRSALIDKLEIQRLKIEGVFDIVGSPTAAELKFIADAKANGQQVSAAIATTLQPVSEQSNAIECPFC